MLSHLLLGAMLLVADPTTLAKTQEHLREGQRLMSEDEFDAAANAFQEAIALEPLLVMAHYGLGRARMGLKEYPAAIAAFEAARDAFNKRSAETATKLTHVQNARTDRIGVLEAQMRDSPERSQRGSIEGTRRHNLQEEIAELKRLQEAGKHPPQLPPGLLLALGSAYFRSGRLADAEREYRAAIEADPKLGEPRSNLAVVLLITGRAAEAKEQLELAERSGFKPPAGLKADVDTALAQAPPNAP